MIGYITAFIIVSIICKTIKKYQESKEKDWMMSGIKYCKVLKILLVNMEQMVIWRKSVITIISRDKSSGDAQQLKN